MKGLKPGQPIYSIKDVKRKFGDREILRGATFSLYPGDHVGVVGVNGAGKSTLMKILAGSDPDYDGSIVPARGLTVGYVPQEPDLDMEKTVYENVLEGVRDTLDLLKRRDEIYELYAHPDYAEGEKLEQLMAEQGEVEDALGVKGVDSEDEVLNKVEHAMSALHLPPKDHPAKVCSGGEMRRVSLVKAILRHPDLLILDEPTNHLDAESVLWLENFLGRYDGSYILVTHDRYFLDNVATRMLEVDAGVIRSYDGNYSSFLEQKAKQKQIRDRTDANLMKAIERELTWIRSSPAARRKKSKARITAFGKLQEQADNIERPLEMELRLPFGPRLGSKVLEIRDIAKGFGEKQLFKNFSFEMQPGAIVGITGANGLGKTTLIKMIMGQETPDEGEIEHGKNTNICYVDQTRNTLNADKTVYEEVSQGAEFIAYGDKNISIRHYLARFLFSGSIQQTKVGKLSGGERNRVQLAKFLRKPSNFVILDEPTNDLDLITLRVLEEALETFPGCAIVITHDRYFLDRVATHILAFEGAGKIYECYGSWDTYLERLKEREKEGRL
jgi:energy-dependent translational throttle protein EttA